MLSKTTVIQAAIIIMREAFENNLIINDGNETMARILEGNIYGIFSDTTGFGATADELHEWYGDEVFEMQAGLQYSRTKLQFEHFKQNLEGNEYIQLAGWGCVDNYLSCEPLQGMKEWDYEEKFEIGKSTELDTAPKNLLVNQLIQQIDWEELWADYDFTSDTQDVLFYQNAELMPNATRFARVLDINSALAYYELPLMDEFVDMNSMFSSLNSGWKVPSGEVRYSTLFHNLVGDYVLNSSIDPRTVRAIGYVSL